MTEKMRKLELKPDNENPPAGTGEKVTLTDGALQVMNKEPQLHNVEGDEKNDNMSIGVGDEVTITDPEILKVVSFVLDSKGPFTIAGIERGNAILIRARDATQKEPLVLSELQRLGGKGISWDTAPLGALQIVKPRR